MDGRTFRPTYLIFSLILLTSLFLSLNSDRIFWFTPPAHYFHLKFLSFCSSAHISIILIISKNSVSFSSHPVLKFFFFIWHLFLLTLSVVTNCGFFFFFLRILSNSLYFSQELALLCNLVLFKTFGWPSHAVGIWLPVHICRWVYYRDF